MSDKTSDNNVLSHEEPLSTLGSRIFETRRNAGMSLEMLASRVGVRPATLRAWENDRSEPRLNKVVAMAGIVGVSPTYFIAEEGNAGEEVKGVRGRNDKLVSMLRDELRFINEQQKLQNRRLRKINAIIDKL